MADKKITELAALTGTTLADGDQFIVVDVSDTSMAASGTAKRIARSEMLGGLGGAFAVSDAVVYVSANGSDTNNGLLPGRAFLTLQAAYAALPSTGGTMLIAPGRYDVGAGLALNRGKPVWMQGLVKPPPYISSITTAPLTVPAAILYTSAAAVSLVTTIGGTASNRMDGCRWTNLLFEFSNPATLYGIDATDAQYGEVSDCYFFADSTTGPANPLAVGIWSRGAGPGVYGGSDSSWWQIRHNRTINMSLVILGNWTGTFRDCNQHIVEGNLCFGGGRNPVSPHRPFISIYYGHRCVIRDNNIESIDIGILMDTCFSCMESGDGGEFVDVFIDLYSCHGLVCSPLGIGYGPLGSYDPYAPDALLVRGNATVRNNIFILPTSITANPAMMYPPTDDPADPSVSIANADNLIIAPRHLTNQGVRELVGTGSPNGVILGSVGDRYWRTDGGANTTFYVKESGTLTNTGWVGK